MKKKEIEKMKEFANEMGWEEYDYFKERYTKMEGLSTFEPDNWVRQRGNVLIINCRCGHKIYCVLPEEEESGQRITEIEKDCQNCKNIILFHSMDCEWEAYFFNLWDNLNKDGSLKEEKK